MGQRNKLLLLFGAFREEVTTKRDSCSEKSDRADVDDVGLCEL